MERRRLLQPARIYNSMVSIDVRVMLLMYGLWARFTEDLRIILRQLQNITTCLK